MINSQFSSAGKARDGDDRLRTDGLRSASAALSQLSYIPLPQPISPTMGLGRVELPTSRLSGVRSNHLSYRPDGVLLGIEKDLRQKTYRRKSPNQSGRVGAIDHEPTGKPAGYKIYS